MRLPRWTIRSMLVVTLLFAILLTSVIWLRAKVTKRARAMQLIEELNGGSGILFTHSERYRKIMGYTGVDQRGFYDPINIFFGPKLFGNDKKRPISNEDIRRLSYYMSDFERLEKIEFDSCEMLTDEIVEILPELPALKTLNVIDTGLTEHGVSLLREKYPNATIEY